MKKTILAMAVPALLVAGAANASVNLYDADGVVVDMSGAAEIQFYKGYNKSNDAYLRIDDADLIFTTTIAVTDSLDAVAGMGFKYEGDTNDTGGVESDELYVGLGGDFGTLTFGRQLLISDDAGNQKDYELGTEQIDFVKTSGAQVIKYVYDNGMFYAGANVDLDNDISEGTDGRSIVGGRVGVRFDALDARVYLYDGENLSGKINGTAYTLDTSGFNAELDYAISDAFDVAVSYGQVEYKVVSSSLKSDVDVFGISGGYQLDEATSFAVGYDIIDADGKGGVADAKSDSLYANVTYKLHSNAKVYAEVGVTDEEVGGADVDTDTGYVLGMEVKF
ncbi:porin [Enterovibrio sp. ZSDZ42]|uniref:Porin n=1 Tax=Enterovibrio gelatinilyticus TaxID=2899819 RepID=A0ABT5QY97_9GAMM|nr:porin [Enterovibrio sp. ZSDZ42]MDD1792995.1 porin [Enterovibrio sp. ZSDZ42]